MEKKAVVKSADNIRGIVTILNSENIQKEDVLYLECKGEQYLIIYYK